MVGETPNPTKGSANAISGVLLAIDWNVPAEMQPAVLRLCCIVSGGTNMRGHGGCHIHSISRPEGGRNVLTSTMRREIH